MDEFSLRAYFPQNYLIRKPFIGAIILFLYSFTFAIIYHPLRTHPSPGFDYTSSMAIYVLFASTSAYLGIHLVKKIRFFKNEDKWTLLKEILASFLIMLLMGIGIYFCGFLLDNPSGANRWTFAVFFDSSLRIFLIGIFPFGLSSIFGYFHYQKRQFHDLKTEDPKTDHKGKLIGINSSLKKESLSFYEYDFLFAEADANYVIFHIFKEGKMHKASIRNSISNIETQLSKHKSFFRTHRAFIVNLNQIVGKTGNALGYQLSLKNSDLKVPVSRQNIKAFDTLFKP